MYEGNCNIDNPNNTWTDYNIERLFIFCQLDRAMSYEKVCDVFNYLMKMGYTDFKNIRQSGSDNANLLKTLKEAGTRFPKQTAEFLWSNAHNFSCDVLREMSREEIVNDCLGFGYKLASMFHNRIHRSQYAIIDIHMDRFLEQHGIFEKDYKKKEKHLQEIAKNNNMTMEQLDWEIWNKNRIGNKE